MLDAFDFAPSESLPLLPLLVHAIFETLPEVLRYATSFQGRVGLPLSQDEAAREQAADGITDGETAYVGVQGLIIVLEEFVIQAEVAHRDQY